jgi:hypothetical protein
MASEVIHMVITTNISTKRMARRLKEAGEAVDPQYVSAVSV